MRATWWPSFDQICNQIKDISAIVDTRPKCVLNFIMQKHSVYRKNHYAARQHNCRAACKISWWPDSKTKCGCHSRMWFCEICIGAHLGAILKLQRTTDLPRLAKCLYLHQSRRNLFTVGNVGHSQKRFMKIIMHEDIIKSNDLDDIESSLATRSTGHRPSSSLVVSCSIVVL